MENNDKLSACGFRFKNETDAVKALDEEKRILYIKSRLDYSEPESVLVIYDKMLKNKIFETPVGYCFLKETREYLINSKEIELERISDVIVVNNIYPEVVHEYKIPLKRKPKKGELDYYKYKCRNYALIIAVLICAIVAMFAITLKSDNPNIINYKIAIENKYASWEQDLNERERELKEKEAELKYQ